MAGSKKEDKTADKKKQTAKGKNKEKGLKELLQGAGYLDNRLERYFIKDLIRKGSAFLRYLITSLKIGIIIGSLFAVLFTAAIVYFNPILSNNIKDSLLLALYLWLIFTIILSVFALLIGIIISSIMSYIRGKSAGAGVPLISAVIIGIAVFAYLSVWWIKASAAAGLSKTGMRDLIALIIITALSFFISRLVFLTGIVLLRKNNTGSSTGKILKFRKRHLFGIAFAALVFFSFLFFLIGTKIIQPEFRQSPDYTVVYPEHGMTILAVDGIDRNILDRLTGRGQLPFIRQMLRAGLCGPLNYSERFVPPVFWTTVATGMNPAEHGIADMSARRFAGVTTPFQESLGEPVFGSALMTLIPASGKDARVPITANLRRSKTFWNILNDKTISVGIVNWWVTWPCEEINGYEVSERLIYKLDAKEKLDKDINPDDLLEKAGFDYNNTLKLFEDTFARFFPAEFTDSLEQDAVKSLKEAAWIDFFYASLYSTLNTKYKVKLSALYLPGLDIVQSKLLGTEIYKNLDDLKNRLESIEKYYTYLDSLLSRSFADLLRGEYLLLITTPGREIKLTGDGNDSFKGFYMISGPGIAADSHAPSITPRDIAPTILYLMGFPQSAEFKGRPVQELFDTALRQKLNSATVETFGDKIGAGAAGEDSNFSREVLEQLRNLGYIN